MLTSRNRSNVNHQKTIPSNGTTIPDYLYQTYIYLLPFLCDHENTGRIPGCMALCESNNDFSSTSARAFRCLFCKGQKV